jgi:C-terminal four TMM region of protein-O-mannosyltransferase/Dolichyl-phosphate-mannose-protein mannosyltransferase
VTGPASGGPERGTAAPSRSTGTQGAVGAVLVVLALGLALRLIIAYLLPGSGLHNDLGAFRFWAGELAAHGPWGFYDRDFLHDYTPGYMYVLWLVGLVGQAVGGVGDLIKVPPVIADLAIGWLAWSMVRELGGRERVALAAAFVAVVNPISWFDSVVWGQVDSFGVVFMLLGLRELWRDRPERAAVWTVVAAIIKPQLGILVPLVAVVTIRRALRPEGGFGDPERTGRPIRILTTGLVGFATAILLAIPFGLTPVGLIGQLVTAGGTYPYLTVNAFNPWAAVPGDTGYSLANSGLWVCDHPLGADACGSGTAVFGAVPAIVVGTVLLLAGIGAVLWVAARRPDRLTLLVGLAVLALAFFVLPTRVHERYVYPFFAVGIILAAISARWRPAYVAASLGLLANMYVVLVVLIPDNPQIVDWFGIGPALKSEPAIAVVALMFTVVFVWAVLQLRSSAHDRLARDLAAASDRPDGVREPWDVDVVEGQLGPVGAGAVTAALAEPTAAIAVRAAPAIPAAPAATMVAMPTWSRRPSMGELGMVEWFRNRLGERPIRADRSRSLAGEKGGRLDRLDLWFLVVLVVATMTLRTFRLAEPYQMHFDEVYHARTATEFLQAWRYGISHDIYEWTHPHLAKYAMALGLVAWGEDDVSATSDLGVPVVASVVEPRRQDPDVRDGRGGERLHVATGSEIRTYDLRTRALISTIPASGVSALAIDPSGLQLVVGYDDGRLATLDLATIGPDAAAAGVVPADLATVKAPVDLLYVMGDGATLAVGEGDHLDIVDLAEGTVVGGTDLAGLVDLADGGNGAAIVATVADVPDPSAAASVLAELLDGNAADYEALLASPGPTVVIGPPGDKDTRDKVEAAIGDGRLAGMEVQDLPRIAAATDAGVTFVDSATASTISTIVLPGGAHGLADVSGIDVDKVYATSGDAAAPTYHVIDISGVPSLTCPSGCGSHPMPGLGTKVVQDPASQIVHILGRAPTMSGTFESPPVSGPNPEWTVYVVEPHGNAVFADARLGAGFVPAAWAADINADYPATDRQELLVFDGSGSMSSIELGSHAFAWRLPGVIAGAISAALIYLLLRILFRRRMVAVLAGLFVLVDGMMFVQSRIGMNDVYVGLFILAAYTLFAAVWTGWWRARWAFWVAMPVIGVLLGLALASKWVALYAIGGVALLILVRSALGRVAAILGLIGLTCVLGYMAITVPQDAGIGNLTFLLVMVALTLVAVVVAVLHPVAWTDEEMRFAVLAPTALGVLIFFGALGLGALDAKLVVGRFAVTPILVALLLVLTSLLIYVVFAVAGRAAWGPLARPPDAADPARRLEAPAPPPEGWLRPGWAFGIPVVWAAVCLLAVPVATYVISYIPWALVEGHRITETWPPGHTGETLLDLTRRMYGYHNGLTSAHPASSPWWAWPLDLKPVWFYQEGLAAGTAAALYDAGNLVIWWMGVPALLFVSVMAFRRRSTALALIAVGFAAQWIPWARIDRAAFQYHYYTALPFVIAALAYFIAELWHGAAAMTWRLARLAGAAVLMGPAVMWIFSRPLCAVVGVESVNPGSQACPAVIPSFVLTAQTAGLAIAAVVGLFFLVRAIIAVGDADGDGVDRDALRQFGLIGLLVAGGLLVASRLPDTPLLTLTNVPVEPIVLVAAIPLAYLALGVIAGMDPRRYVIGFLTAVVGWFVILYPNISALPLPSALVNAYQGILPTYLYAFQFPVSKIDRNQAIAWNATQLGLLTLAVVVTCLVVAYSASVWRLSLATAEEASDETDGLARTGGA